MEQYPAPNPPGQPQGYGQPFEYRQPQMYVQPPGYGHPGQPNIISTQGNVAYASPNTVVVTSGGRPPNGMVLAILACLFCFWPTGVCAIMYASQANNEVDNNMAWSKYRTSRTLSIVSIVVGMIWIAIAIWRIVEAVNYTKSYYSYTYYG
ncbi:hypothetical protein CHS0354_039856 [Potamilus streckersoni]|uniref:Uncharacterized protein n=1 Tax=Potamilus streckersoni TaxID=2493646 RepID=A0AAE0SS62_9BIVA|nr:hypothetical protein CHS0354_039856 [Potamilus streckersoni]